MIAIGKESYRVFMDLGTPVCPARCSYCYVSPGQSKSFSERAVRAAIESLPMRQGFAAGRDGTIITFGGHTDLFLNRHLITSFLRSLPDAAAGGNPIQVSTKGVISASAADAIAAAGRYEGQITIFVSCATITRASELEMFAPTPEQRWVNFSTLNSRNLANCLLVKPWLGEATAESIPAFADVIHRYGVRAACLGAIFISPAIRRRLGFLPAGQISPHERHPLDPRMNSAIQPLITTIKSLRRRIEPVPVSSSSLCVSAMFAKRSCPLHPLGGCGGA